MCLSIHSSVHTYTYRCVCVRAHVYLFQERHFKRNSFKFYISQCKNSGLMVLSGEVRQTKQPDNGERILWRQVKNGFSIFFSWLTSRNTFSFLSIQEDLFPLTPTFSRLLRKHPGSCWQLRSRECWQESWYWEPVCLHQVGFFCTWGLTGNLIPGQLVVVSRFKWLFS